MTRVVDLHNHVSTPACETLLDGAPPLWLDPFSRYSGAETTAYNARHFAELTDRLTDPARRLELFERVRADLAARSGGRRSDRG